MRCAVVERRSYQKVESRAALKSVPWVDVRACSATPHNSQPTFRQPSLLETLTAEIYQFPLVDSQTQVKWASKIWTINQKIEEIICRQPQFIGEFLEMLKDWIGDNKRNPKKSEVEVLITDCTGLKGRLKPQAMSVTVDPQDLGREVKRLVDTFYNNFGKTIASTFIDAVWSRISDDCRQAASQIEHYKKSYEILPGLTYVDISNNLVLCNQRLVLAVARQWAKRDINQELGIINRFSAGIEGLYKAIRTFDPNHGCEFSTHAAQWIRSCVQIESYRSLGDVYLPESSFREARKNSCIGLHQTHKVRRSEFALAIHEDRGGSTGFEEVIQDDEYAVVLRELEVLSGRAESGSLEARNLDIMRRFFGLSGYSEHTLEEAGSEHQITKARAGQICAQIAREVRERLAVNPRGRPPTF